MLVNEGFKDSGKLPNSSSLNIAGSITLEAWIKLSSVGAYQEIITRESYGQSGTGGGYGLTVTNLGKPRMDLYHTPTTYTPVIGSTSMSTGVWYHVAGVWDGAYLRIYLNGVLDGTTTTGSGPASHQQCEDRTEQWRQLLQRFD